MQGKVLLLAETARDQQAIVRIAKRTAKELKADIAVLGQERIMELDRGYPGGHIKTDLSPEDIWEYEAGIFLNPSLKTLSKFVNILIDNIYMEIIYEFLLCEQPLFFPDICENPSLQMLPEGLQKKAQTLLNEAERMGVHIFSSHFWKNKKETEFQSRLITEELIKDIPENETLLVKYNAVFTPLALDLIREKHLHITRGSGG